MDWFASRLRGLPLGSRTRWVLVLLSCAACATLASCQLRSADRSYASRATPPGEPADVEGASGFIELGAGSEELGVVIAGQTITVPSAHWNAWWENEGDAERPAWKARTVLKPKTTYNLFVDLATARFESMGIQGSPAGAGLARAIAERLADPQGSETLKLQVLVIPESRFFSKVETRVKDLIVDLRPLKQSRREAANPASVEAQFAELTLGVVGFSLKTLGRVGPTSVAISIWYEDAPIDELVVDACIGREEGECAASTDPSPTVERGLSGLHGFSSPAPEGALHFVELARGKKLLGVFRSREWPAGKYLSWELAHSAAQFKERFASMTKDALDDAMKASHAELEARGLGIARTLFNSATEEGALARKEFVEFAIKVIARAEEPGRQPSLFVRTLTLDNNDPLILPMGMLALKSKGRTEFLGFHFNVQTPMGQQSYEDSSECVERWVFALPTVDDADLGRAWAMIHETSPWKELQPRFGNDATQFRSWLADEEADPENTLLVVLAHHERDRLWFDLGRKVQITSADIARPFARPTAVILNGCGTGNGESDFVRELNVRGATSGIVTNTQVSGRMAGAFLNCLAASLPTTESPSRKISELYMRTVLCLRDEPAALSSNETFGARALAYSFVGNGNVTICPPR